MYRKVLCKRPGTAQRQELTFFHAPGEENPAASRLQSAPKSVLLAGRSWLKWLWVQLLCWEEGRCVSEYFWENRAVAETCAHSPNWLWANKCSLVQLDAESWQLSLCFGFFFPFFFRRKQYNKYSFPPYFKESPTKERWTLMHGLHWTDKGFMSKSHAQSIFSSLCSPGFGAFPPLQQVRRNMDSKLVLYKSHIEHSEFFQLILHTS